MPQASGADHYKRQREVCKQGHEWTPENTKVYSGYRWCLQCKTESNQRYRAVIASAKKEKE